MNPLRRWPRLIKRCLGYARQIGRDQAWHRRFVGPDHPPRWQRSVEQARLLWYSAIDGEDYYHHGLYRPELAFETKAAFLGHFEKTRYYDRLNPAVYDTLARDKVLFHLLASSLGLPTPEVLATTGERRLPSAGLHLQDIASVRNFLEREDAQQLFLKPADGSLGEGALSLGPRYAGRPAWERLPDRSEVSLDQVLALLAPGGRLRRYLIQRRLRPHPDLDRIMPDVCPTNRMMTLVAGTPTMLGAALRLGSGAGPTDNLSGGGVVVPIDDVSGRLGLGANLDADTVQRSEKHPTTGQQITGLQLPHWAAARALALDGAAKLAFLPCIGWDIGITDHGPVIVEINSRPRCRPIQIALDRGLLDGPLGKALACHDGLLGSGLHVGKATGSYGAAPNPISP